MSDQARRHRLEGFEPDNLLAFLALLGVLRAVEAIKPSWRPRAAWDLDHPPLRPVLELNEAQTKNVIARTTAGGIELLAKNYHFPADDGGNRLQRDLDYPTSRARELLKEATTTQDRGWADLLCALMSDIAEKNGRIQPTPFCLLFGQGHQHFLERLASVPRLETPPPRGRGKRAVVLTPTETIFEALFQPWLRQDPTPSFRWDPAEDVRYALRANDPSSDKATTQHGANRLAAIGIAALPVVPIQDRREIKLRVLGGSAEREFMFYWPIWREAATLAAVRAMLSHPNLSDGPEALAHLGVAQVRCACRISTGKFRNFTRRHLKTCSTGAQAESDRHEIGMRPKIPQGSRYEPKTQSGARMGRTGFL